jgi:hypothetical protein
MLRPYRALIILYYLPRALPWAIMLNAVGVRLQF